VLAILAMLARRGALRVAPGGSAPPISFVARRGAGVARSGRESRFADRTGKQARCGIACTIPKLLFLPASSWPQPHAKPSPLFDPPEAGRMSGCPPSQRFFAATGRRSGQGMKPLRGAHSARVPWRLRATWHPPIGSDQRDLPPLYRL